MALDPLSLMLANELGWTYYNARQYDEAIAEADRMVELDPKLPFAYLILAMPHGQKGTYDEAIAELKKARTLPGGSLPAILAELGYAYATSGRKAEAQEIIKELRERATREFIDPVNNAIIYIGLGEKDQAFASLEKAYQEHSVSIIWLNTEPKFDSLRSDPRFGDLMQRVGLPQ